VAREGIRDKTLVAVDCGANVNFDRLRHIAERAEIGEQREVLLAVTIPERAGSLRNFCDIIGRRAITEFNYRFADPGEAHIFVGVELRDGQRDRSALIDALTAHGYPVLDLSENEMAKIHVRYMVGGRARDAANEVLYRFDFPERPGALLRFLTHMGEHWNISLFHYRNHGADYGRVLMGLQVPPQDSAALQSFLDAMGYEYQDESANPAYRMFLR
jgi:threonine dehydratase